MKISTTAHRIAAVLVAIIALAAATGIAQAATSRPAGMSKAAYQSLLIRSQALDDMYGSTSRPAGMSKGAYRTLRIRSEALDRMYGHDKQTSRPAGMSQAAYRSLVIRSQALDDRYRNDLVRSTVLSQPSIVATNGFAWSDFGIGAAAMLGLVLVASGLIAGGRHARRASNPRISA